MFSNATALLLPPAVYYAGVEFLVLKSKLISSIGRYRYAQYVTPHKRHLLGKRSRAVKKPRGTGIAMTKTQVMVQTTHLEL